MKLIASNIVDLQGLDSTSKVHRPFASRFGDTQPQEPIHVQVRIRQYADALPELRRAGASSPNLRRLPVGLILDCYL